MPALGRVGVSRKIEDEEARRTLRDIMHELNPPRGLGFIVRTAGTDRTKKEISRDLAYLLRLWKVIVRRIKKSAAPVDDLRRKRHDHPHDPRHLHRRGRRHLHRRAPSLRTGQGIPANRHAAVRQPPAIVRRQGTAVPQVQHRRRNRQNPPAQSAAATRRLDRHRSDRGPGGHRRQQRQLPRRRQRRGNRLPDEPVGRQGNRPATAPARPGRRDRERLHRHAQGDATAATWNAACATP